MRCKGTPRFISSKNVKPPEKGKDRQSQRYDTENTETMRFMWALHIYSGHKPYLKMSESLSII